MSNYDNNIYNVAKRDKLKWVRVLLRIDMY